MRAVLKAANHSLSFGDLPFWTRPYVSRSFDIDARLSRFLLMLGCYGAAWVIYDQLLHHFYSLVSCFITGNRQIYGYLPISQGWILPGELHWTGVWFFSVRATTFYACTRIAKILQLAWTT